MAPVDTLLWLPPSPSATGWCPCSEAPFSLLTPLPLTPLDYAAGAVSRPPLVFVYLMSVCLLAAGGHWLAPHEAGAGVDHQRACEGEHHQQTDRQGRVADFRFHLGRHRSRLRRGRHCRWGRRGRSRSGKRRGRRRDRHRRDARDLVHSRLEDVLVDRQGEAAEGPETGDGD